MKSYATATVDGVVYSVEETLDLAGFTSAVSETTLVTGPLPELPGGVNRHRFFVSCQSGMESYVSRHCLPKSPDPAISSVSAEPSFIPAFHRYPNPLIFLALRPGYHLFRQP
jgi:hypothetical protein